MSCPGILIFIILLPMSFIYSVYKGGNDDANYINSPFADFRFIFGCPNDKIEIRCEPNKTIYIHTFDYSPVVGSICIPYIHHPKSDYIKDCNKKEMCNYTGMPKNPRYHGILFILYKCIHTSTPIKLDVTCEDANTAMACEEGTKIQVLAATYGRALQHYCNDKVNETVLNCTADGAFYVVRHRCLHQRECSFQVTKSMFGDPCPGITKYLTVKYTCQIEFVP